jgi:hypothetical protein
MIYIFKTQIRKQIEFLEMERVILASHFAIGTAIVTSDGTRAAHSTDFPTRLSHRFHSIMKITLKTLQQKVFTVRKQQKWAGLVAGLVANHPTHRSTLKGRTLLGT